MTHQEVVCSNAMSSLKWAIISDDDDGLLKRGTVVSHLTIQRPLSSGRPLVMMVS